MDEQERVSFLKKPVIDPGGRQKQKRVAMAQAWGAAKDQAAAVPLGQVLLNEKEDREVRQAAIQSLGQIGNDQAIKVLGQVIQQVSQDQELRMMSLMALGTTQHLLTVTTLLVIWPGATSLRSRIQQLLGKLPITITAEPLIKALQQSDKGPREMVHGILSGNAAFLPYLAEAAAQGTPDVVRESTVILKQAGALACLPLLGVLARVGVERQARLVDLLNQIDGPLYPCLIAALCGADEARATAARLALTSIGAPAIKALLKKSVDSPQIQSLLREMATMVTQAFAGLQDGDMSLMIQMRKVLGISIEPTLTEALCKKGKAGAACLVPLIASEDAEMEAWATNTLRQMGSDSVLALLTAMDDSTLQPRAVKLIEEIGYPALEPLFDYLCGAKGKHQEIITRLLWTVADPNNPLAEDLYQRYYHLFRVVTDADWKNLFTLQPMMFQKTRVARDTQFEDAKNGLSMIQRLEQNAQLALPILKTLLILAPDFAKAHYLLGEWAYYRLNDRDMAIDCFNRSAACASAAVEEDDHLKSRSHWWLGVCYGDDSPRFDYDTSMSHYQQAIDLGWQDKTCIDHGRNWTAFKAIGRCLALNENAALYFIAVQLNCELLQSLEQAEQWSAEQYDYLKQKQKEWATTQERRKSVGDAEVFRDKVIDFAERINDRSDEERTQAIYSLRKVLDENPDRSDARILLARVLLLNQQIPEGLHVLRPLRDNKNEFNKVYVVGVFELCSEAFASTLETLIKEKRRSEAIQMVEEIDRFLPSLTTLQDADVRSNFAVLVSGNGARFLSLGLEFADTRLLDKAITLSESVYQELVSIEGNLDESSKENVQFVKTNLCATYAKVGTYYALRKQWAQAAQYLRKSTEIDMKYHTTFVRLAIVLGQLGDMRGGVIALMLGKGAGSEIAEYMWEQRDKLLAMPSDFAVQYIQKLDEISRN